MMTHGAVTPSIRATHGVTPGFEPLSSTLIMLREPVCSRSRHPVAGIERQA